MMEFVILYYLHWLMVFFAYKLQVLILTFKARHKLGPIYLTHFSLMLLFVLYDLLVRDCHSSV